MRDPRRSGGFSARRGNRSGDLEFWKLRARTYNRLQWAQQSSCLRAFVRAGGFRKGDVVLDVGTGTGIVAHAVAPMVAEVIGLDKSQDMLAHSNWRGNKYFIRRDIRTPIFADGVFDKVTARMVFHHILEGTQEAMNECHRVLKPGGLMVFSEGIPPCAEVKPDYEEIFRHKEKRLTFMEGDLVRLMRRAGFRNIRVRIHWMRRMSVRNWLENSGLPPSVQRTIFLLHEEARPAFRRAYRLMHVRGDCLIDMKMAILTGEKEAGVVSDGPPRKSARFRRALRRSEP
ncbi:MAG: class I SAM-dependent methyltransferase [bacterium]|nr:class I SAM-dependent methyltransferase [bacterium]